MSLSAHKLYAPKGTGALFVRRGVRLVSQNVGGHQEREKRAGTEGVPGIVAFGMAAKLAREEMAKRSEHERRLRDRFEAGVTERIEDIVFNGDRARRLPHLSNISFSLHRRRRTTNQSGPSGHRSIDGLSLFFGDT